MKFGQVLKSWMKEHEVSYEWFADELGLTKSTICRILQGKDVDSKTLLLLIDWLFYQQEGRRKKNG